ncbi:MAG: hypothetical protein IJG64_04705 [Oscillospiraceae bacterium]|nr:hypothetical protein [Oscillospiraceae bacterium]
MQESFYKLGYGLINAIPVFIFLFLIRRIRKNRQAIKDLEEKRRRRDMIEGTAEQEVASENTEKTDAE